MVKEGLCGGCFLPATKRPKIPPVIIQTNNATADQFESRWLGNIVVLEASDPHATAYQPAPPWTFTLREQEEEIELNAVRDGTQGHGAAMPCASWMAAARQALVMMTGWSLPDDIVDYAARALRVRTLLGESMTSGQLDELLTMYEWAHSTAARGGPWMSSEYAAVFEFSIGLTQSSEYFRTNW